MARSFATVEASGVSAPETLWREYLGPLLSLKQVQERLALPTPRRVSDLARRRRLLGLLTRMDGLLFPAFQFSQGGEPYTILPLVLETLEPAVATPYTIACWFVTPQPSLNGQTPARWLKRGYAPERVAEAARLSAARLAE